MKRKLFVTLALVGTLGATSGFAEITRPDIKIDVKCGADTEYVYRGRKQGCQNFQRLVETGIRLGHRVFLYGGTNSTLMVEGQSMDFNYIKGEKDGDGNQKYTVENFNESLSLNETAPFCGLSIQTSDLLSLDMGYVAHLYTDLYPWTKVFNETNKTGLRRNTNELYMGFNFNAPLKPRVYISYDFDREEFCSIASFGYSYDCGSSDWFKLGVEFKGHVGYDYAKRPYGIKNYYDGFARAKNSSGEFIHQKDSSNVALGDGKGYAFWGVDANLVYKYGSHARIKAGVRYAGNAASKDDWNNYFFGGHKNMCWFTSGVECNF